LGGAPCPFKCGVILETICDLTNELLKCKYWEPTNLHALVQHELPKGIYLDEDIPFAVGRELIIDIPIDHQGYANVYIDDTTGLTLDLPGTRKADHLEAAIPLAIEIAAHPNDINKPIPREPLVAQDKLKSRRRLSRNQSDLGVALQLPDTYRHPPGAQAHRLVDRDSTQDACQWQNIKEGS
jgi:hypothetical protein